MRRPVALTWALSAASVLVAIADVVLAVTAGRQHPAWYAWEIGSPLVWVGVGVLAVVVRPDRRVGLLMQLLGLILLLDAPAGFVIETTRTWGAVDLVVARTVLPFQVVVFAHLLLSYPEGRIHHRSSRRFIAALYGYGALVGVLGLTAAIRTVTRTPWTGSSPESGFAGGGSSTLVDAGWLAFAVVYPALMWLKVRRASPGRRKTLAYPLACGFVVIMLFALSTVLVVAGATPAGNRLSDALPYLAVVTMPGAFLLGLLRERLRYGSVADFVRAVEHTPIGRLQPALRKALRDPTLRLVFPQGDRYVDEQGEHVSVDGRAALPIGGTPPIGLVLHDPALEDEPKLLTATSAATRLALDNARLHAVVRRQLVEARASRRRIVEAAATERRRLERDLHDGAQQRILAVGIALRLLQQQLDPADQAVNEAVQDARQELVGAIAELRELARGIHPAVLTEQGLSPAVRALARRQPLPVAVDDSLPRRLPQPVETAAYFVVSEALTNVVKHAHATCARVRLALHGDVLRVEVSDDGVGGAVPENGSGLRGLADRAAAFDGTLSVTDAVPAGTLLIAELSCD
ncbi:sensor histidine kinase [Saccharothrix texasensis]|uniref:histidine kinase n=1 Tax=Saccharothrix texasensis TaxID=103734 RepID=A0A3N1HJ19_9PSEU|nr:sensor histidine kinase [Saccharothrix texasensis]ROP42523.1 histidine kinase [Saccharothrix texasensis]